MSDDITRRNLQKRSWHKISFSQTHIHIGLNTMTHCQWNWYYLFNFSQFDFFKFLFINITISSNRNAVINIKEYIQFGGVTVDDAKVSANKLNVKCQYLFFESRQVLANIRSQMFCFFTVNWKTEKLIIIHCATFNWFPEQIFKCIPISINAKLITLKCAYRSLIYCVAMEKLRNHL